MKNKERTFVIHQYCKTKGIVRRDMNNLNICSDPSCSSCAVWNDGMNEVMKEFVLSDEPRFTKEEQEQINRYADKLLTNKTKEDESSKF